MNNTFNFLARSLFLVLLLVVPYGLRAQTANTGKLSNADKQRLARFEKEADELRVLLEIPGMSAAIVKNQKVVWAKGFGFADVENRIPATPDTVFHLASITKTFAATLIMQLVEQGKLDLDEPMSHYSNAFKDDSVKIKHLLTHTSEGTPGDRFAYNGYLYNFLTAVIEKKFGKPFQNVVVETFFDPLDMSASVPYHNGVVDKDKVVSTLEKDHLDRYEKNLSRLAHPYTLYGDSEIINAPHPSQRSVGAAAGLLSTVLDMAKYDAAIDRHMFLKEETQQKAWTPFVSNSGKPLPYGLGWFVMDYHGLKLIWHTGDWGTGFSGLYLKVPEKNLSLIVLANSEALVEHHYEVGEPMVNDIVNNVFACNFLRLFVFEDAQGRPVPDPHWTENSRDFSSEISRLVKQSNGYEYQCELNSQTALAKWRENRRKEARVSIQLDPKILETYAGVYEFEDPPPATLTVSREGGRLFINWPGNFKSELFAESESNFFFKVKRAQLRFIKTGGQVTHLEFLTPSETVRMKKIK